MKKENIHIARNIAPGTSETIRERIKANGIIETFKARFYSGQERDLTVYPYIENKGSKAVKELFTFVKGGEKFLAGNDDYFVHDIYLSVAYDDELVLIVENKDDTYNYTLNIDVAITYNGQEEGVK